jgi:hypothetical protein
MTLMVSRSGLAAEGGDAVRIRCVPAQVYDQRRQTLALSIPERREAAAQQLVDLSIF